jgi:nitrilase
VFFARESRSFVISVSSLMTTSDFPSDVPNYNKIVKNALDILANGGSCIASLDGE